MAAKDKKDKKSQNIGSGRLGSFSGAGTKFQTQQKRIYSTPWEFAFGRTNIPGQKLDNKLEFSEVTSLGCYSLELAGSVRATQDIPKGPRCT